MESSSVTTVDRETAASENLEKYNKALLIRSKPPPPRATPPTFRRASTVHQQSKKKTRASRKIMYCALKLWKIYDFQKQIIVKKERAGARGELTELEKSGEMFLKTE